MISSSMKKRSTKEVCSGHNNKTPILQEDKVKKAAILRGKNAFFAPNDRR